MALKETLAQFGISCPDGKKTTGYLQPQGTEIRIPVTMICGQRQGPDILLTGGVHGGEYPCIETAIRLGMELSPEVVCGNLAILHPVNPPAFFAKLQYYGPSDGKNLNRVFPGKALGTTSERIAHMVHQLQREASFYLDLHGGDIHEALVPFVIFSHLGGAETAEKAKAAASALGFPYLVGSYSDTGSVGAAAKAGVPGFLAELGQCGRWSEPEVSQYMQAVKNALRHLGVLDGAPSPTPEITCFEKMLVVQAIHQGCWYPEVRLEQWVNKGDRLGEIRDFFGRPLSSYFAEESGLVLYLVTSLAITEGDPLLALGVHRQQ